MKKSLPVFLTTGLTVLAVSALALQLFAAAAAAPAPIGSIRPAGKLKPADLPALTKISFADAAKAAVAAVPGSIIAGELEIEDGNLQYSFQVVGADKAVTEVEIDAGNGKVLATDKEEAEDEDKPAASAPAAHGAGK